MALLVSMVGDMLRLTFDSVIMKQGHFSLMNAEGPDLTLFLLLPHPQTWRTDG